MSKTSELLAEWHLGSMNDGLFIINRPSRPSNDDQWFDRPDGPTIVLNVTELPAEKAMAIIEAHNAALRPTPPSDVGRDDMAGLADPHSDAGAAAMQERCAAMMDNRAEYFERAKGHRDWTDAARSYRESAKQIRSLPLPALRQSTPSPVGQDREAQLLDDEAGRYNGDAPVYTGTHVANILAAQATRLRLLSRSPAPTVAPIDPFVGLDERLDRLLLTASDNGRFILSTESAKNIVGIVREWLRVHSSPAPGNGAAMREALYAIARGEFTDLPPLGDSRRPKPYDVAFHENVLDQMEGTRAAVEPLPGGGVDRAAVIEECARVADAARESAKTHHGIEASIGADIAARRIRALAAQPEQRSDTPSVPQDTAP